MIPSRLSACPGGSRQPRRHDHRGRPRGLRGFPATDQAIRSDPGRSKRNSGVIAGPARKSIMPGVPRTDASSAGSGYAGRRGLPAGDGGVPGRADDGQAGSPGEKSQVTAAVLDLVKDAVQADLPAAVTAGASRVTGPARGPRGASR